MLLPDRALAAAPEPGCRLRCPYAALAGATVRWCPSWAQLNVANQAERRLQPSTWPPQPSRKLALARVDRHRRCRGIHQLTVAEVAADDAQQIAAHGVAQDCCLVGWEMRCCCTMHSSSMVAETYLHCCRLWAESRRARLVPGSRRWWCSVLGEVAAALPPRRPPPSLAFDALGGFALLLSIFRNTHGRDELKLRTIECVALSP